MENNLKKIREKKKISVLDACHKSGVKTTQYWYSLENSRYVPSVELALRIAKTLGVKIEQIWKL